MTGGFPNHGEIEIEAPGPFVPIQHEFSRGAVGKATLWLGAGGTSALIKAAGAASLVGTLEINKYPGANLNQEDAYVIVEARNVRVWFDRVREARELKEFDVPIGYAPQQVRIEPGAARPRK